MIAVILHALFVESLVASLSLAGRQLGVIPQSSIIRNPIAAIIGLRIVACIGASLLKTWRRYSLRIVNVDRFAHVRCGSRRAAV